MKFVVTEELVYEEVPDQICILETQIAWEDWFVAQTEENERESTEMSLMIRECSF